MSKISRLDRASRDLTRALMVFMDALAAELATIRLTVPPHTHELAPAKLVDVAARNAAEPGTRKPPRQQLGIITVWTKPRLEILERDYQAGVALDVILERVNACPAPGPVKRRSIGIEAARWGWRRPAPADQVPVPEAPAPPEACPSPAPVAGPTEPRPAAEPPEPAPVPRRPQPQSVAADALRGGPRGSPEKKPATGPAMVASFEQILRWAGERGIIVRGRELPMDEINARRRHLGQAPFALQPPVRGRAF